MVELLVESEFFSVESLILGALLVELEYLCTGEVLIVSLEGTFLKVDLDVVVLFE